MSDTRFPLLDTPGRAFLRSAGARLVLAGIGIVMLCSLGSRGAAADPVDLDAKVVWVGDDFAVISSRATLPIVPTNVIRFFARDKMVAEGSVRILFEPTMAVVVLASGSRGTLKTVKRLDHLRVTAESVIPKSLRLGYPAAGRPNLMIACDSMAPPISAWSYRTETLTDHQVRWVRNPGTPVHLPWPDTMMVRLFDDSADEEIAFERGDLDIALFWPGELSRHARDLWPQQPHSVFGPKPTGVIAALRVGSSDSGGQGLTDGERRALARMGDVMLGTDLFPYWNTDSQPRPGNSARFEVDHGCPGWQGMERFLNNGTPATTDPLDRVHVFYLDASWNDPRAIARGTAEHIHAGSFPPELKARADSVLAEFRKDPRGPEYSELRLMVSSLQVSELYRLQCAILYQPRLDAYIAALGSEPLFFLLRCAPAESRP
jgi:hypothetical protein